jgi:hypothetical protein
MFSNWRWENKSKGIVTFIGDKIQFENGSGASENYIYESDYDPASKKVLDIRATPGKL